MFRVAQMAKLPENTRDREYTQWLVRRRDVWWKRLLHAQALYGWNLRRLRPGFTLEIGCGIGRNLVHLRGQGVGVDHNPHSARIAGAAAYTPQTFRQSEFNRQARFDSLLLSHVAEHMTAPDVVRLIAGYMDVLKPEGKVICITPQEAGFRRDPTHVQFMDFTALEAIFRQLGLRTAARFSFPFWRPVGRLFPYNEFVIVGRRVQPHQIAGVQP